MINLNSSAIKSVDYDASTLRLKVWFVESGGPYDFCRVPACIYEGLVSAASVGAYFNAHIRDRYQC